jgi:hypothetical protein
MTLSSCIDDCNLEPGLLRYSDEVRQTIRVGLNFKAEHNLRRTGLLRQPAVGAEVTA